MLSAVSWCGGAVGGGEVETNENTAGTSIRPFVRSLGGPKLTGGAAGRLLRWFADRDWAEMPSDCGSTALGVGRFLVRSAAVRFDAPVSRMLIMFWLKS